MLAEKAGKFRMDSYGMRDGAGDGPTISTKIHRNDFTDSTIIEVNHFLKIFILIKS